MAEFKNSYRPVDFLLVGGLNDVMRGRSLDKIKKDLTNFKRDVTSLKRSCGGKVRLLLQQFPSLLRSLHYRLNREKLKQTGLTP